jgi:hypothetical protein
MMEKIVAGKKGLLCFGIVLIFSFAGSGTRRQSPAGNGEDHPRIVNIVNFIRLLEPRVPEITEDVCCIRPSFGRLS